LLYNYCRFRFTMLSRKRLTPRVRREASYWQAEAKKYQTIICFNNMPLVISMADRKRFRGDDGEELVSVGNEALARAIDYFDAGRGFRFSTYACWLIIRAFGRYRAKKNLIAERFPVSFDPMLELPPRGERPRGDKEKDLIGEVQEVLRKRLGFLSSLERRIIVLTFNLDGFEGKRTLGDVGNIVGLSGERVRQIRLIALDKLKDYLESCLG